MLPTTIFYEGINFKLELIPTTKGLDIVYNILSVHGDSRHITDYLETGTFYHRVHDIHTSFLIKKKDVQLEDLETTYKEIETYLKKLNVIF